jgi:23S rRNA (uracil1939-C5)-methyltransferase
MFNSFMHTETVQETISKIEPLCTVFGTCGGCAYQHLPYEEELKLKEKALREQLALAGDLPDALFDPITPSPEPYYYRNRLDLTLRRKRNGFIMGYTHPTKQFMIPVEACPIARKEISDFLPTLRDEAIRKFPDDYKIANLVVRTGADGRVVWGGIGRHSCVLKEENYFWTEIEGRKIFYSLDTFFQANLSILPALMRKIREFVSFDKNTVFFDLYSGVGLFGIFFAPEVKKVWMIETGAESVKLARFNAAYYGYQHLEIREAHVEKELPALLEAMSGPERKIAMIDPPRRGLSSEVAQSLAAQKQLEGLLYLSCSPESLARDLAIFQKAGWQIKKIAPFDFFPRTVHLETLVLLEPCQK